MTSRRLTMARTRADTNDAPAPRALVVMGVSGVGKTTVGRLLAERLGLPFVDADGFHPEANVRKMAAGRPLTDADRTPWLDALHAYLHERLEAGESVVLACSALRARYRRRIAGGDARVRFVYLRADPALVARRLAARTGHFMPPALLESQFAALEEPAADEALVVDADGTPREVAARAAAALAR